MNFSVTEMTKWFNRSRHDSSHHTRLYLGHAANTHIHTHAHRSTHTHEHARKRRMTLPVVVREQTVATLHQNKNSIPRFRLRSDTWGLRGCLYSAHSRSPLKRGKDRENEQGKMQLQYEETEGNKTNSATFRRADSQHNFLSVFKMARRNFTGSTG